MDLTKVLHRKSCVKCGTVITGKHMKPPFIKMNMPKGYYGNRVKKLLKAVCDCGEEYIALLSPGGNSYTVIDLIKEEIPRIPSIIEQEEDVIKYDSMEEVYEVEMPDLDGMKRQELIKLASKAGVKGNLISMKNDALKESIREAMVNAEKDGTETEKTSKEEGA